MLTMTRPLRPVPITRPMTNINKMTQEFHSLSSPSSWSFVMNTSKVTIHVQVSDSMLNVQAVNSTDPTFIIASSTNSK
jgi:hypothetical protein